MRIAPSTPFSSGCARGVSWPNEGRRTCSCKSARRSLILRGASLTGYAVVGPRTLGWPTSRDRRLSCGLSRETLVWLGPSVQADFERFFQRRCLLTGSVFFQASQQETMSWVQEVMKKRMRVTKYSELPLKGKAMHMLVLTAAQLQRLQRYQTLYKEHSSLSGTFIVDVDHWPDSGGPAHGPTFPAMLRHGTAIDLGTGKVAMGVDRCLALGFQAHEYHSPCYAWPLKEFVLGLKDRVMKSLTGNSQNVAAILAWYLYVLSHTCRREECHVQMPLVQKHQNESSEEEP